MPLPTATSGSIDRVCLFDIDGTLISTLRAGLTAMEASLRDVFGVSDRIEAAQIAGFTDRSIAALLFRKFAIPDTEETWQRFLAGYLDNLPAVLAQRTGHVLPGIVDLLTLLGTHERTALGLLTGNTAAGAKVKLAHYGIHQHFSFGAFGDRWLTRNEVAADALEVVRREVHAEVSPQQIIVLGDTPLDVACARSIGARAVAVATGIHSVDQLRLSQPDLLLADLADPAPLLALLA